MAWHLAFFEHGQAWVQHSAGDPPAVSMQPGDYPSDCLMITIEGPGALIVSQDDEVKAVKAAQGQLYFWDGILN